MNRTHVIISLILVAVIMHLVARTMRQALPFLVSLTPAVPVTADNYRPDQKQQQLQQLQKTLFQPFSNLQQLQQKPAQQPVKTVKKPSLFASLNQQTKQFFKRMRQQAKPAEMEIDFHDTSSAANAGTPTQDGTAILQIIKEDPHQTITNPHLGLDASLRLDEFLEQRYAHNAELTTEVEKLFGQQAKKEVIRILFNDEVTSYKNATESKTAQEFAQRQEKTDQITQQQLSAVFERHKKHFNSRLTRNSPDWNTFFKQVNNFERAKN